MNRKHYFLVILTVLLTFMLLSCSQNPEQIKKQQYTLKGQKLYTTHCQNCHQQDGSGLGKLIPPLAGGHFSRNIGHVICTIRHGKEGLVIVDSVVFTGKMPANYKLTSLEIASIVTYLEVTWGAKSLVSIDNVDRSLQNCQR